MLNSVAAFTRDAANRKYFVLNVAASGSLGAKRFAHCFAAYITGGDGKKGGKISPRRYRESTKRRAEGAGNSIRGIGRRLFLAHWSIVPF